MSNNSVSNSKGFESERSKKFQKDGPGLNENCLLTHHFQTFRLPLTSHLIARG
jgi:hypothetical protein